MSRYAVIKNVRNSARITVSALIKDHKSRHRAKSIDWGTEMTNLMRPADRARIAHPSICGFWYSLVDGYPTDAMPGPWIRSTSMGASR